MRLRSIYPPLSDDILDALEDAEIGTDEELLFSGDAVDTWTKLSSESISIRDVESARTSIISQQAAPMVRGDGFLEEQMGLQTIRKGYSILSGVPDLDRLVGDLSKYRLLEISGDTGSGKTVRVSLDGKDANVYSILNGP